MRSIVPLNMPIISLFTIQKTKHLRDPFSVMLLKSIPCNEIDDQINTVGYLFRDGYDDAGQELMRMSEEEYHSFLFNWIYY